MFLAEVYAQGNESALALEGLAKNVKLKTLPNGLKVILYKRGTAPVFSGIVAVRVGGSDEVLGQTGISHMLEHMAFKGTTTIGTSDYQTESKLLDDLEELASKERDGKTLTDSEKQSKIEINKKLKELWILGDFSNQYDKRGSTDMNATTDKELTRYFVSMPNSAFEFWCWMESERILHPVMRQFYQERDVVMEERRMRSEDDPGGKLYEQLLGVAYLKHPYRNPVIGYDFDIRRLTAKMVADYHKLYYVPSNIVISAVGDLDIDEASKTIEKYFGRIPSAVSPEHPKIVEPKQTGERRVTLETKAAPQLVIAYHKPNYPHPDDPPLSLMAEILAGSKVSPLYTELVKNRRLASGVGHDEGPGSEYPNLSMFSATVSSPHTNQEVLEAFDDLIHKFKNTGVTQAQLDIAKRSIAMSYLAQLKSNLSLAQDFASAELLYGDWKASINWYNEVMRVTPEDIQRVTNAYLINSNRIIGMVENSAAVPKKAGKKKQ